MDGVLVCGPLDSRRLYKLLRGTSLEVEGESLPEIRVETRPLSGGGFTSRCEFATISLNTRPREKLELFVKRKLKSQPQMAQILEEIELFKNEAYFFRELLPSLLHFCKRKCGDEGFLQNIVPMCYFADEELVALENLAHKGLTVWDSTILHDLEQVKAVMHTFSKLHGASYAYFHGMTADEIQSQYPLLVESNSWGEANRKIRGLFVEHAIEGAIKILKAYPTEGSEEAMTFFRQYSSDPYSKITKYFDFSTPSCALVLNHGDLWNNNIMWHPRKNSKEPLNCIFIDWQQSHLGSPALDLGYYLYYAVESDVMENHWKELLRIYYEGVKLYAKILGVNLEFSYKDMLREYQAKCDHGFVFKIVAIILLQGFKDIADMDSIGGDCIEYLSSLFRATIDRINGKEGYEVSSKLVKAFKAFCKLKNEVI